MSPFKKRKRIAVIAKSSPSDCDAVDAYYLTIKEAYGSLQHDQVIILPWALSCVCTDNACPAVKNKPERRVFRRLFREGHGKDFKGLLKNFRSSYEKSLKRLVENHSYRQQWSLYSKAIEALERIEALLRTVPTFNQADIDVLRSAIEKHKNGVF